MYTLYARKGAGSFVVEAVLAEAGQRCRIIDASPGANGKPHAGLLKLNPLGQVPTLVLPDGTVMTESAAMVIHLADRFPKAGLAPAPRSTQRPLYLRWMLFMAAAIYPAFQRQYYPNRYSTLEGGAAGVKGAAVAELDRYWGLLSRALGKGPWLLGRRFSAADVYAAMLATWNEELPAFHSRYPNIRALVERVRARSRIAPAWAANEMPVN
jgi:glutathione S-transferase